MLEVPVLFSVNLRQIRLPVAIFQVAAHVVVEQRNIRRRNRRALRIVLRVLAQRIQIRPGETSVQAPRRHIRIVLQRLLKLAAAHAQIRFEQVGHGQSRVLVQFLRHLLLLVDCQVRA